GSTPSVSYVFTQTRTTSSGSALAPRPATPAPLPAMAVPLPAMLGPLVSMTSVGVARHLPSPSTIVIPSREIWRADVPRAARVTPIPARANLAARYAPVPPAPTMPTRATNVLPVRLANRHFRRLPPQRAGFRYDLSVTVTLPLRVPCFARTRQNVRDRP